MKSFINNIFNIFFEPRPEIIFFRSFSVENFIENLENPDFKYYTKINNIPIYSLFSYQDPLIKLLITEIKFKKNHTALELGKKLLAFKLTHFPSDYIYVPIPMSPQEYKKRGFNQTLELLKGAELILKNIRVVSLLKKIRETSPQVKQNKQERLKNLHQAFALKKPLEPNSSLIIFDDVLTTGATMTEAIRAFITDTYPPRNIIGITFGH